MNGFDEFRNQAADGTGLLPSSFELYRAARAYRAQVIGELVRTAARALVDALRRARVAYLKRRREKATYGSLTLLDDRTLRDLGLTRSEIRSFAAEFAGRAERTRMRVASQAAQT